MLPRSIPITIVLGRAGYTDFSGARRRVIMQEKQAVGLFLEIFAVVAILGALAAVAIPHVGQMIDKSKVEARATEYQNIQTAVTGMLYDSVSGILVPAGPTADMSLVRSGDATPLVLTDYLFGLKSGLLTSGCTYTFAADGTVAQIKP